MAQDGRLARTASGDSLVLVPLVFDEDGYMHTARSFNALVDSVMRAMPSERSLQTRTSGEGEDLDVMFTDYGTFVDVIEGETAWRSGTSYAHLIRRRDVRPLAQPGARRQFCQRTDEWEPLQ